MNILYHVVKFEAVRMRRNFAPVFFALAFPVLMLCIFGGIYGNRPSAKFNGLGEVDISVPGYLILVVAVTGLMSFPLGLAEYRDRKILRRFRATPVDASSFLFAQGIVNVVLSLIGAVLLFATGYIFFGLHLPRSVFYACAALLLGTLTMYTIGGVVASLAPSERSATAIANIIYFPMIFLSGATIPLAIFPSGMKVVSDILPATYAVKLLQDAWVRGASTNILLDMAVLFGVTIIGSLVAIRVFRWE